MKNHYHLLEIETNASFEDVPYDEIRKKYRHLALKYHPDKSHAHKSSRKDQDLFIQIQEAYRVLSDPLLRKSYDQSLQVQSAPPTPRYFAHIEISELSFVTSEDYTGDQTQTTSVESEEVEAYYECRCGGRYKLNVEDLQGLLARSEKSNSKLNDDDDDEIGCWDKLSVPCDSCSFFISVTSCVEDLDVDNR